MHLKRLAVALLACLVALLGAELAVRLAGDRLGVDTARLQAYRDFLRDGNQQYRPYPYTNYVAAPPPKSDPTHPLEWGRYRDAGNPDVLLACLGGSTTWGDYPGHLQKEIDSRASLSVQVQNWGVPGWTSLETMVNYFINVQDHSPDIVVILHAINDATGRLIGGYRTDYAHWRKHWTEPDIGSVERILARFSDLFGLLSLRGREDLSLRTFIMRESAERKKVDSPLSNGSERGFVRNITTIVEHVLLRGGTPVLVTQPFSLSRAKEGDEWQAWAKITYQHNDLIREIAREHSGCILVDTEKRFQKIQREGDPFIDHVHLTSAWQRVQAEMIAKALGRAGLLD